MSDAAGTDFETSLRSVLQALALDPQAQIALYEPGRCVPCLLGAAIQHWEQSVPRRWMKELAPDRRQALAAAAEAASAASRSHACYDNLALTGGPEFAILRQTANDALRIWGWQPGTPDPQFLYGTSAAAERAARPEPQRRPARNSAPARGKPRLVYHKQLVQALGFTPAIAERNVQLLQQREQELGITIPASVFELLSLEGITGHFRERSNQDELITNEEFDESRKLERLGDPRELAQGFLCVAVENQGVVGWYVPIDGSADPPVFHNNDQWLEDMSKIDWVPCADSFSAFIRDMLHVSERR
jgi:hypothetical protein